MAAQKGNDVLRELSQMGMDIQADTPRTYIRYPAILIG